MPGVAERILAETTIGDLFWTIKWLGLEEHVLVDGDGRWRDMFTDKTGQGAIELLALVLDIDIDAALDIFRRVRKVQEMARARDEANDIGIGMEGGN